MDIPKELRFLLLQRGGMERITKQLQARQRIAERAPVVFSTQEITPRVNAAEKNKGCYPCSDDVRANEAFTNATSGRTKFWSLNNGTVLCSQEPRIRVNGESKSRR